MTKDAGDEVREALAWFDAMPEFGNHGRHGMYCEHCGAYEDYPQHTEACPYPRLRTLAAEVRRLQALASAPRAAEAGQSMQRCWDAVNAMIVSGPLPGNGTDKTAERNGLVLASNTIMQLMRPAQSAAADAPADRGYANDMRWPAPADAPQPAADAVPDGLAELITALETQDPHDTDEVIKVMMAAASALRRAAKEPPHG